MELMNGQNDRREVKLAPPLRQLWMTRHITGGDPVLMDGKLYLVAFDIDWRFREWIEILELDKKTGQVVKEHRVAMPGKLKWRRMMGYQGKLYVSTVWTDSTQYPNAKIESHVWAYDPVQEKVVWEFHKVTPFSGGDAENIGAWLNAENGKVFLTLMEIWKNDNKLYCFDAQTGQILWKTNKPERRAVKNTYPAIGGGKVFLGTETGDQGSGGKIVAFDINTGKVVWEREFKKGENIYEIEKEESFVYRDGRLYVPFHRRIGKGAFAVLDAGTGKDVWWFEDKEKGSPFSINAPLIDGERFYAVEFEGSLCGINKTNGRLMWRHDFAAEGYPQLRFMNKETVVYSTREGDQNYLVWVDKKTGKETYRHEFPAMTNQPGQRHIIEVIADDNFLVVGLEDGRLYGMEGSTAPQN
jgi:outer membrane protein assembly factor BamB